MDDQLIDFRRAAGRTCRPKPLPLRHALVCPLVVVACALLFERPALGDDRTFEPLPRDELRVRVMEAEHAGQPVAGARVRCWRLRSVRPGGGRSPSDAIDWRTTDADGEGRVVFRRIERSRVGRVFIRWTPEEPLFVQVTAAGHVLQRRVISAADRDRGEVQVALSRGLRVSGRVIESDGTPAARALVTFKQPEQRGWDRQWYGAPTSDDGRFELAGLAPGAATLRAEFYEGDGVWVATAVVEAGAAGVVLRLPSSPERRRLRLRARGLDGEPIARAIVRQQPSRTWWGEHAFNVLGRMPQLRIEDGLVTLPADADVQFLALLHPTGPEGQELPWGPTIVGPLGSRGGELEVVMDRGHVVSGMLRYEDGEPIGDVTLGLWPRTERRGDVQTFYDGAVWGEVDRKGSVRIEGVPAGRWRPIVGSPLTDGPLADITVPGEPLDLRIRRYRRYEGELRHPDGLPAARAVAYVRPSSRPHAPWREVYTDLVGDYLEVAPLRDRLLLRFGLEPTGPEDLADSEVTLDPESPEDTRPVFATPPPSDLLVRVPGWPSDVPGAVRLVNGPYSRPIAAWIVDGVARFQGIDGSAPVSLYAGPLPNGRIALAEGVDGRAGTVDLPWRASRTIRAHVRGVPEHAYDFRVWADSSAFEAPGRMISKGIFELRGVPPGPARVCAWFRSGARDFVGRVSVGATDLEVVVEIQPEPLPVGGLDDWRVPRPVAQTSSRR